MMKKALILVLIAECWITAGQICFKKGSNYLGGQQGRRASGFLGLGAAFMLTGMMFWFGALSRGDLSFVYLLGSSQYIYTLFAAHFVLQEKINTSKVVGTLLITLGIILTAIS